MRTELVPRSPSDLACFECHKKTDPATAILRPVIDSVLTPDHLQEALYGVFHQPCLLKREPYLREAFDE